MTWLLTATIPNPSPVAPPGLGDAVNTLLGLTAGVEAPTPLLRLPTELIVRQSTAAARTGPDR